ncbi:MAG: hypothetical protein EAZ53_08450 [Bacteroidetes bacterium]|nr:MAG: hypothetical protein EAZ53_08450 [Bacteroidota bacterium]
MKKSVIYIFTFIYLVFSTGFTVNAHYCAGDLQSISFFELSKDCNKCGKKKMKGCCKDVSQSFQVDDEHIISSSDFSFKTPDFQSFFNPIFNFKFRQTILNFSKPFIGFENTPLFSNTPIYIRLCSFLI